MRAQDSVNFRALCISLVKRSPKCVAPSWCWRMQGPISTFCGPWKISFKNPTDVRCVLGKYRILPEYPEPVTLIHVSLSSRHLRTTGRCRSIANKLWIARPSSRILSARLTVSASGVELEDAPCLCVAQPIGKRLPDLDP